MNRASAPVCKDLVLVGGGHSHLAVLKRFGMRPLRGVRLTLIARDVHTPYSGMLPGFIAGHYSYDESHIDLRPLARFAQCRLIHDEAVGLDRPGKRVMCRNHPPIPYDVLSIDIGSRPQTEGIPGAAEHAMPVKPIDRFLAHWDRIIAQPGSKRIAVVGGGAGGVELVLSMQFRLRNASGLRDGRHEFHLVTDSDAILPSHNARVRARLERILRQRGIHLHTAARVLEVRPHLLVCAGGLLIPADEIIWVTHAAAPAWPREAGIATDAQGFIEVNDCLQSLSDADVFAAGDIAAMINHPRPKSGVFAVRQGPPLARNLRRALLGRPLRSYRPQSRFLGLIGTGDGQAVASRDHWSLEGRWVWRWKEWIDRRFMRRYSDLPRMREERTPQADVIEPSELPASALRCGGCGAKIGANVLTRVLARLAPVCGPEVLVGLESPDDAAVVQVPPGKVMVHTVDFFRTFLDDPYLFGAITANHCLNDIFAMGADPQSALAVAVVPYGLERKMEEDLYQMMAGALEMFRESGTTLLGGHTAEGGELALGFAVNGVADGRQLLRKAGMRPGDCLILTKPLGTGTLFAADMRGLAKGRWIEAALASMLLSNRVAARIALRHGATACTDVTGFGLVGHLVELARASRVDAELYMDALPILDGALETLRRGIYSSIQPQNLRLSRAIGALERAAAHERYPLLFDPQTAGGLLFSIPGEQAQGCLAELRRSGYGHAAIIGRAADQRAEAAPITLGSGTYGP